MKGLITKDLMCLRKQRFLIICVFVSVCVVSVMYVLSANFGNVAKASQFMLEDNGLTEIDARNISNLAMCLFMALPLAAVCDMSALFTADGKAGFFAVAATLPVSIEKRVLSRFITILMFFGIGAATDIVIAVILSFLTDTILFAELFAFILAIASVLIIYGSLLCFYMVLFGYGKESYAQLSSILTIIAFVILTNFKRVKEIFISCFSENAEVMDVNPLKLLTFITQKYIYIFAGAIAVVFISYILSVFLAKRKRGIM